MPALTEDQLIEALMKLKGVHAPREGNGEELNKKLLRTLSLIYFLAILLGGPLAAHAQCATGYNKITVPLCQQNAAETVNVTTHHYDNLRTGWNQNETILTQANVSSSAFGLLHTVTLDDQVDAQPLVVTGLTISGATHNVVYVVTENNTVYAIDDSTGSVLLSRNLGSPVANPLGCLNNGPNVGITGTPVIDTSKNAIYLIAYVNNGGTPTYYLHALSLTTLSDLSGSPVTVFGSHTLSDGSTYAFNATYSRQRPALLLNGGTLYAGFGSFCDFDANLSRGWVLGWTESILAPISANQLNDTLATSPNTYFFSSVWMSGAGSAADSSGNVYFTTGNSDPGTYTGATNIQESVVKMNSSLTTISSIFTPSDYSALDSADQDISSGGVMLIPTQSGSHPNMAVASGKDGRIFLMDQTNLGGFSTTSNNVLYENDDYFNTGNQLGCWCAPVYFKGSDGNPYIAYSLGGNGGNLTVWLINTSGTPSLSRVSSTPVFTPAQEGGFFSSVSSNGTTAGTDILWIVSRPDETLYAYNAIPSGGSNSLLFSAIAGSWTNTQANANIVPVVANGKVFVATLKKLTIFGLH
jgi:hypothetical protein